MSSKEQIISQIKTLGYRVSIADLSNNTGLPLFEATQILNKIALDCQGNLEVTNTGNIIYEFEHDFEQHYVNNALKQQIKAFLKIVFDIFYFIVRISFGVLLIASFLTVAVVFLIALIIILISSGELGDGDGDSDDMGIFDMGFDFYDIGNLFLFFNWRWFDTKYDVREDDDDYGKYLNSKEDKGFFLNCFSFLFGNGNPNYGLDKKKWRYIAEIIRRNNGVITAEQLSPYTGDDPRDEYGVFSTLVRFNGIPEVTAKGNIVYIFPQLQAIAAPIIKSELPNYLSEDHWQFTTHPLDRLFPIYFFGGANLAGCYCLWQHLPKMLWLQPFAPIIGFMLTYAVFFLGFPVVRQIGNIVANAVIDYRNQYRQACYDHLNDNVVKTKLVEAKLFIQQIQNLNKEKIVYTTAEDILAQEFDDH